MRKKNEVRAKNIGELIEIAEKVAFSFIGSWYKWGGNDPSGFDCSGFVCEILQSVGLIPRFSRYTSAGLFSLFMDNYIDISNNLDSVPKGGLVFWGKEVDSQLDVYRTIEYMDQWLNITHVEYAINSYLSIGASGGGRNVLSVDDAIKRNAFIKVRPIAEGRSYPLVACDPYMILF